MPEKSGLMWRRRVGIEFMHTSANASPRRAASADRLWRLCTDLGRMKKTCGYGYVRGGKNSGVDYFQFHVESRGCSGTSSHGCHHLGRP